MNETMNESGRTLFAPTEEAPKNAVKHHEVNIAPDWKQEYLKLSEGFIKQRKELEDMRSIGLAIFDELERVLDRINSLKAAAEKLAGDDIDPPKETYAEYIAYLQDENREMREQLKAQRYLIDRLQKGI